MYEDVEIKRLKKEKSVWIYGIGRLGKKLCSIFEACDIAIEGIIVSDSKQNPLRYGGMKVYSLDACAAPKDALIIIAVNRRAAVEVAEHLSQRGYGRFVIWSEACLSAFWKSYPHLFVDRRKGKDKVLFVLSGYKLYLWDSVFSRLKRFLPDDVEVCLCSSGIYDDTLAAIAAENVWSYLSTSQNSVTLIQNIAYAIYEDCTWIYKMDEDIFLTNNTLSRLYEAYVREEINSSYRIGVMAPVIPLNQSCYRLVLEKYHCLQDFEERYGRALWGGLSISAPDVALYLWGKYGNIPGIDQIASDFREPVISLCSTRYNIGLILIKRTLWSNMSGFTTSASPDMGLDEEELDAYCVNSSRVIMIAHDAVAGHFAFGPQSYGMREYMKVSGWA
ncbi:MAG: hypothetical protein LUI12_12230 [Clostridiales bacterium]|nr:hypothetical protein [Clostridiales bacterium]